ncbi:protein YIF1A isoform X3 [Corythoichthys intestinalis]|uniref:protein YIF1A isoform X3 n=1 Tax=Corythoichthys intestinalis TaxID=161448 RepID=UPI0025A51BB4|nr:protein YIF1A isoform X3 [Corythoichthys intestinalis]
MDLPHQGYRASKQRGRGPPAAGESMLFDDTSTSAMSAQGSYYTPGYNVAGPPTDARGGVNNLFSDPMANAAVMYGSSLANQGKDMVNKEDWEVRYHRDTPLTPRQDVNAPDLYIPTMAFITYILLAGTALGIQKRFSPEVLGLCASTALAWVLIEVLVMLLTLYLLTVHSDLSAFDLVAYSGYKYVGMIFSVLCGLLFGSDGYFAALAWSSCALMFFIVRSLKMKILTSLASDSISTGSGARPQVRMYITVAAAIFQPLIIYWLTSHLVR